MGDQTSLSALGDLAFLRPNNLVLFHMSVRVDTGTPVKGQNCQPNLKKTGLGNIP